MVLFSRANNSIHRTDESSAALRTVLAVNRTVLDGFDSCFRGRSGCEHPSRMVFATTATVLAECKRLSRLPEVASANEDERALCLSSAMVG